MTRSEIFSDTDTDTDITAAVPQLDDTDTDQTDTDSNEAQEANTVTENTENTEPKSQEQNDAEHQPTVDAFNQAVADALAASDPSTGTVPEANLDAVAQAYRGVTGGIKYKNLARRQVDADMKAAIGAKDYMKAVALNEVSDKIINTRAEARPAGPKVDPKVAYGQRVAALSVAAELLEARVPEEAEGFEVPATERAFAEAQEFLEWQEGDQSEDAPELSPVAAAAVKLVSGKGLGKRGAGGTNVSTRAPYTGVRRNVAAHIESAFDGVPSGTFLTVSEIAKHDSDEYGDDHPSSGAVNARLFPGGDADKCTVEGITPGHNGQGVKGATKN